MVFAEFLEKCCASNNSVRLELHREGNRFHPVVKNCGEKPIQPGEAVLFEGNLPFDVHTSMYGESYQMLHQTLGTIEQPLPVPGSLTDKDHYRLPCPDGYHTMYHYVIFHTENRYYLAGFSSCHIFVGAFSIACDGHFRIAMRMENVVLQPGESRKLEEFCAFEAEDREAVLSEFGAALQKNHTIPLQSKRLTGWCSWYCYGGDVTRERIMQNVKKIKELDFSMKYVQIDDGYQAYTGDWLDSNQNLGGDIQEICHTIRKEGFSPAIWVAPFVAEENSTIFRSHPDWFVAREDGTPLPAGEVTFCGWQKNPWYMLDTTHPDACAYLEHVFYVMKQEWGCTYFKLDANMWGGMPFGIRHARNKTSVEAYRMGMEAIRRGVGKDSILLGCNAPMWHSIGTVDAMRVTGDICRSWNTVRALALQLFGRNWQNDILWSNDPDCIVLTNNEKQLVDPSGVMRPHINLTPDEIRFHMAYILASGGMVLSGDAIPDMTEEEASQLRKVMEHMGNAARFDDFTYETGHTQTFDFYFNYGDINREYRLYADGTDWFTGRAVNGQVSVPPHSAAVICKK